MRPVRRICQWRVRSLSTRRFGRRTGRNSNVVFRWEYRPGSVLFVVWQQGRADGRNPGTFEAARDLQSLFATNPNNTFLIKLSYWFNP